MHIHSTIFPIRVTQSCVAEVERLTRHRPGAAVPVRGQKKEPPGRVLSPRALCTLIRERGVWHQGYSMCTLRTPHSSDGYQFFEEQSHTDGPDTV